MNANEKRQLETELLKMGLAGLQPSGSPTGELVQQIAGMVNTWPGHFNRHGEWVDKHLFLRDLLAECDEAKRYDMYTAIVPHLKFKARPLDHYEALMAERVGNLVSKRRMRVEGRTPHPIELGGEKFVEVSAEQASQAIATLKCYKCGKSDSFLADTPAGAMIAGRKAGWVRDMAVKKEVCPECAKQTVN